ncbi:hypothetical protein CP965_07685 [Halarcobacter mediterraneus]|uniref:VCBS repeat-containing protein n=1 Tax=Halarcobacter mediterraneus TaxID=2023153 RepID=A0A4Q1ATC7_9BACT|nr:hypothetical protein [Halarcobacter mediterraneus]RXK12457.1 hypothetical protein CP965_07685 [Halarcobacter mediterraneus]
MIVENSQVGLYSESKFTFEHKSSTNVQLHYGYENQNEESQTNRNEAFSLDFQYSYTSSIQYERVVYNYEDNLSLEDRIKKAIIEKLLERLYNEDEISLYPNKKSPVSLKEDMFKSTLPSNPYEKAEQLPTRELKAMTFDTKESYYHKQSVEFSASIKFQTPNKSYEMSIDLSFSQELYESKSSRMIIGDERFVDPLVVNFDEDINPFDNISPFRFAFDLDSDGETEMIPYLKHGAGFLALDKNENGKIDNGKELFGPQTNYGFKELAMYDEDNNSFIDENDSIFDKLKIWSIDSSGNNSLISLLDANVGAIYLGDVQSGYAYKQSIESTDAIQKSNGIFIKEDGSGLGVVNSIDVVV